MSEIWASIVSALAIACISGSSHYLCVKIVLQMHFLGCAKFGKLHWYILIPRFFLYSNVWLPKITLIQPFIVLDCLSYRYCHVVTFVVLMIIGPVQKEISFLHSCFNCEAPAHITKPIMLYFLFISFTHSKCLFCKNVSFVSRFG